jgi:hypothetical protein
MKQTVIFLLILIIASGSNAQSSTFLADRVTGNFYKPATRPDVEGSPLLLPDWVPGVLYLKDGHKADKFLLNVDLYSNEILFQHEGNPLVVVNPVKEIVLFTGAVDLLFRAGYLPVDKNTETTFYQVLQDGPTSLLKLTRKIIKERKEYNQPVVKEFDIIETYYIVKAGKVPEKISKNRKSVLEAISDRTGKLEIWVEKNGYKCKTDDELKKVVKAFNENQFLQ